MQKYNHKTSTTKQYGIIIQSILFKDYLLYESKKEVYDGMDNMVSSKPVDKSLQPQNFFFMEQIWVLLPVTMFK